MRAVIYERFGNPAEVLHLGEMDRPEPGPGQVRIRLILSPIHNHDLSTIAGTYGYKPPLPAVPGTEALGVVDALGEGVSHLAVGQRVAFNGLGLWAEYAVVDAQRAVPLPDSVSDEIGCQLLSMPMSAVMLLDDLDVGPGDWIIQNTANGAVGKTLAGLARARGVNVVNLVRRDAGVAELEALGIANGVSTESEGWQERVKAITGGAPIVRAVDSVAGEAADQIMSSLAEGGVLVSFGAMSGKPLVISPANLLFKQATVRGFWGQKRAPLLTPERRVEMVGELIALAASGGLQLPIAQAFDFEHAGEAAAASAVPGRPGKIAIKP